jgi:hypothetical protein
MTDPKILLWVLIGATSLPCIRPLLMMSKCKLLLFDCKYIANEVNVKKKMHSRRAAGKFFSARGALDARRVVVVDECAARATRRRAVARGDRLRGLRSFANSL